MKILILRTIAHTEIWENDKASCYFPNYIYNDIKTWEPGLININLDQAMFAIGIYASRYFSFISKSGRPSFNNSIEETQPSLLKLQPIYQGSSDFMQEQDGMLRCHYRFVKKFSEFDQQKMHELDRQLLIIKKQQIGNTAQRTRYDSLCFSLDYRTVENLLNSLGVNIP